MAEPSQDWGLILLGNQQTWEIKAGRENKHGTYSVLLNTVQKHLNKQKEIILITWTSSGTSRNLMRNKAYGSLISKAQVPLGSQSTIIIGS